MWQGLPLEIFVNFSKPGKGHKVKIMVKEIILKLDEKEKKKSKRTYLAIVRGRRRRSKSLTTSIETLCFVYCRVFFL